MPTMAKESDPQTFKITTMNLPKGNKLHDYYFGPDNLVREEVDILIDKFGLDGEANNYAVELNSSTGSIILDHGKNVEFYGYHFDPAKIITVNLKHQGPAEPQAPNLDNLGVRRT